MQSVSAAFTAEGKASARGISQSVQVAWKKALDPSVTLFTIGVSSIGGVDIIAGTDTPALSWTLYQYFDESEYVNRLSYERELNMPVGGVAKALFDIEFDNTSNRFLPDYAGGDSELYTAILPRRPLIINAGYNIDGVDTNIAQMVGVNTKTPRVSTRDRTMTLEGSDFLDFLENKYVDQSSIYTGIRSDTLIENILTTLGYSTAEYDLDMGLNTIPVGVLETGSKFLNIINDVVQAEYGHFYQDEEGVLRFDNRTHWTEAPFNTVQKIIYTADVIDAEVPSDEHIINVVEVKSDIVRKQIEQTIYDLPSSVSLPPGDTELFIDYENPILEVTAVSITANNNDDGSGIDKTSSVTIKSRADFADSTKFVFTNSSSSYLWLTGLTITGRPAKTVGQIYTRRQDDSSVTAYEQRPYVIENKYVQDETWSQSLAQLLLNDFSDPESLQELTIRAKPELQMGDLISWQGRYWRIFGIQTTIDPSYGFIQKIKILKRTIETYFTIGVSSIGSSDRIAP